MKLFDQNGRLDADVQDALYELGNVGVGMASVTIGKILGVRVELVTPNIVPVKEIVGEDLLIDAGKENVGIWMQFREPLNGSVLFSMDQRFINAVVYKMTGRTYDTQTLFEDELSFSAITEFTNMLSAAYMKAIGSYTGLRIFMSPVMVVFDKESVSLDDILKKQGTVSDKAILIETSFLLVDEDGSKITDAGRVIMLPDDATVGMLMEGLGL